jgi:hypothetical protein
VARRERSRCVDLVPSLSRPDAGCMPKAIWHRRVGRQRARDRCRWSLDRRTIRRLSRGRLERELRHVGKPTSGMYAAVGAQRRSSVRRGGHGLVRRSRPCLGPRSSPRALTGGPPGCPSRREDRGRGGRTPAVSGTGSTSARSGVAPGRVRLSRSTVAMVVAETSIPSFRSSPRILR